MDERSIFDESLGFENDRPIVTSLKGIFPSGRDDGILIDIFGSNTGYSWTQHKLHPTSHHKIKQTGWPASQVNIPELRKIVLCDA